jgi:3-oxoadipate enol-lactonase
MARPTVVLLHPFPLGPQAWEPQRRALEEAGWPVATPDASGENASDSYAATAKRVLGEVDGDIVTVGASMGGHLSFELWRQAPERIKAMVLVDTRATPDTDEQKASRDSMIGLLENGGIDALAERMSGMGEPGLSVLRARPAAGLVATLKSMRDRPDSTSTLAEIDVPVLVLNGENDPVVPPAVSKEMLEHLPNARYAEIPGAGHMPGVEKPEETNRALLEFLGSLEP